MNNTDSLAALESLLNARKQASVESVLDTLLATNSVTWRVLGDRDSNYATVHLTASPDVSLVERVTNSIDATFERIAESRPELKTISSPRIFSEQAIGFKDCILADSVKRRKKTAADDYGISIELWDGDNDDTPTCKTTLRKNSPPIRLSSFMTR